MLDTSAPLASSLRARGGGPSAQGAQQSGTALRRRRGGHPRRTRAIAAKAPPSCKRRPRMA